MREGDQKRKSQETCPIFLMTLLLPRMELKSGQMEFFLREFLFHSFPFLSCFAGLQ